MRIKSTVSGLVAFIRLSKANKKTFWQLPNRLKKAFFKLPANERDKFVLFVDIMRQNSQKQVISSVRTIANQSGTPAVELYEYLDHEAKKQRHFAKQKLENFAADSTAPQDNKVEITAVSTAREMRERLSLLREQTYLNQNIKRRSRKQ